MPKVTLEHVQSNFAEYGTSPWREERQLVREFLRTPEMRLTGAIFAVGYDVMALPYWDFQADARRHAMHLVKDGIEDSETIVDDYRTRIFVPSRETILNAGVYSNIINDLIEGLPPSKKSITYQQVIRGHYGFDGRFREFPTLAKELDRTKFLLRELNDRAIKIMRHPTRSKRLSSYLEEKRREFFKYLYEPGMTDG